MKKQNLPVWKLIASSKRDLTLRTEIDYFQTHFVSKSMIRDWQQPLLRISGHSQRLRDFVSWMSSVPVISANAKKGLEDLISPYVEILPLIELRGKLYYAINVLKLVDCLDRERSDILYSPVDGGILQVRRSIFRTDRLLDVPIFKLPDDVGQVFVTRSFVDAVIETGLRGAAFADPGESPLTAIMQRKSQNIVPGVPE